MAPAAKIQFFGHATFLITSESGKRILIDPWLSGNPSCPSFLHNPENLDFIVLTHGHSDHAGSAVALAKKTGAMVFAAYELLMLLVKEGVPSENTQPMNKGGTVVLPSGLAVSLTDARHSSSYDAADGHTYYAGEACGAVLRLESGKTVYHAGDTSLFSDMKLIGEEFRPEVALMPIGDRFTMGPRAAAAAVELIKPKLVIPMHFGTFPLLSGTPEEFRGCVKEARVEVLLPGQELQI